MLHIATVQITLLEHFSVQGSYLEMPVVVSLVLIQSGGMQTRRQQGGMALHCTEHFNGPPLQSIEGWKGGQEERSHGSNKLTQLSSRDPHFLPFVFPKY